MRFVDTNIFLRYLTKDDPLKAEAAVSLLLRVERGEEKIETSSLVLFETIFTLEKSYHLPKATIRQMIGDIISLRGLHLPQKRVWTQSLDLYARLNISFADAFNAVYMNTHQIAEIYSWDADFDKGAGIVRLELSA